MMLHVAPVIVTVKVIFSWSLYTVFEDNVTCVLKASAIFIITVDKHFWQRRLCNPDRGFARLWDPLNI